MGERFKYLKWREGVEPLPTTPGEELLHRMSLFYPAEASVASENLHPTGQLRELFRGKPGTLK